jgi:hypothetical protein
MIALAAIAADVCARWAIVSIDVLSWNAIETHTVSRDAVLAENTLGAIETLARLGAIVMFLVWVYQAAANVRRLGRDGLAISPGMCVGWFFVPIANLVMPYQAVSQIAVASDAEGRGQAPGFVLAWWLFYVGSSVTAAVRRVMSGASVDLGLRIGLSAIADVAAAAALVALFFTMRFIDRGQRYWASQPKKSYTDDLARLAGGA